MLLADRAYARREALGALVAQRVKVVVRTNGRSLPLLTASGQRFKLKAPLRKLKVGQVQEWPRFFRAGDQTWPIRLCAIRKSAVAAQRAQRKARRKAQTHQHQVSADALELSKYVLVLTNLAPEEGWSTAQVLELYRCRWQIELAFKRLKSLLQLGQLPKQDPDSARAWLQLKLLLALLIERLCHQARFFSPGVMDLSVSRWRAWQEMAEPVLTTLRGPLSLAELIRRGPRLRRRLRVQRPKRPLQMEHVTNLFLS